MQRSSELRIQAVFLVFLLGASSGCASAPATPAGQAANSPVTLMTFNVENLFDTQDDPAKRDETFLPLSKKGTASHRKACEWFIREDWRRDCLELDWSEKVLKTKLQRVASVIRSVNGGMGPDLIVLQEVENQAVLERLRLEHLRDLGYGPAILIEGEDLRGIDVGMLSRLPQDGSAQLHPPRLVGADLRQKKDSRGILEARFRLPDGTLLTAFGVHLHAPFHPVALRRQMLEQLTELMKQRSREGLAFAAGDFNLPQEEDRKERLTDWLSKQGWIVAHQAGCEGCRGTSYYPRLKQWSFLDMILLGQGFVSQAEGSDGWRLKPGSVRVENRVPEHRTSEGFPAAFIPPGQGVSDHWPLALEIDQ